MTREILHDLGFFGHYLHKHAGGRGGKQFVLATLHKNGGKLTQRELLERTNNSPAALSEVMAKLEGEGLITRAPYEQDRRQQLVQLTSQGEVHAAHKCAEREDFERKALSCLTHEETVQLESLLARLVEHWKHLEDEGVSA